MNSPLGNPIDSSRFIVEDRHLETNIGQLALGYLKKNFSFSCTELDLDTLETKMLTSWMHYLDFYFNFKKTRLFLLLTRFDDSSHAAKCICKIIADYDYDKLRNELTGSMQNTCALIRKFNNDIYFILLDENAKNNENVILHEFIHYVQLISNMMRVSIEHKNIPEIVKNAFGVSNELENYIFNRYEFMVNIYVDFFRGMQKTYWTHFSSTFTWKDFISNIMEQFKLSGKDFRLSMLYNLMKIEDVKCIMYLNVLACIGYVNNGLYDIIVEKMKNEQ